MVDVGICISPSIKRNIGGKRKEKERKMKKLICCIIVLLVASLCIAALTPETEHQVISSKTSQIFHKFDCRYAGGLTLNNADIYDTYEKAIETGLRACKTCEPQPSGIDTEDPEDPNTVVIKPSYEAANLFPINGMVIQSGYCKRAFDPNDIGVRIIEPTITQIMFGTFSNRPMNTTCSFCLDFDTGTGEGNVPSQYIIPVYNLIPPDPNIPDVLEIESYIIGPDLPIYKSNQSITTHLNPDCEYAKSIPVHMVNIRNGLVAGSNAYWNPVEGILEWRMTPFEAGDYISVLNTDVGQTQLGAITVRPKGVPSLEDFTARWLKGNFNLIKYGEWISDLEMWNKYLGRISSATGSPAAGKNIEWIFEDGRWVPVIAGTNIITEIDVDSTVSENRTEDRQTITKELKIAPYEWRTTEIKVVNTELTTFEGYTGYSGQPPVGSTDYLARPPYTASPEEDSMTAPTPEEIAAHYVEIRIAPPPEEIKPPQDLDEVMTIADNLRKFTALPESFRLTAAADIIDSYMVQKKAYKEYLEAKTKWEQEFQIKEDEWHMKQQDIMERDIWEDKDNRYEEEMLEITRDDMLTNISALYVVGVNELTDEEKDLLLNLRRKIINRDIDISSIDWEDIERTMQEIDSPGDTNE